MELIWGIWYFFGLITGLVIAVAASSNGEERYVSDKRDHKRKLHRHNSDVSDVPDGNRGRGGDKRSVVQVDKEEIRNVLMVHRIGATYHEKIVIDTILEMIGSDEDE